MKQMDIFDFISPECPQIKAGEWVTEDRLGKEISFDEIAENIGEIIILDMSTQSTKWYKAVVVEQIVIGDNGHRRLVCFDGTRQRGVIDEMWFKPENVNPSKAYRLLK